MVAKPQSQMRSPTETIERRKNENLGLEYRKTVGRRWGREGKETEGSGWMGRG